MLKIDQINIFDTHFLLGGNEALPESLNKIIFAPVHNYKVLETQAGLTNMWLLFTRLLVFVYIRHKTYCSGEDC